MDNQSSLTFIYTGTSMYPFFRPGDRLYLKPYSNRKLRRGDIVVFKSSRNEDIIAHRVIYSTRHGIRTRGDNNKSFDPEITPFDHIIGVVEYFQRGKVHCKAKAGLIGYFLSAVWKGFLILDSFITIFFRPIYRNRVCAGIFKNWLPKKWQPRVVGFNRDGNLEFQLHMGRYLIGKLQPGKSDWHIRRPFRIFIDEKELPHERSLSTAKHQFHLFPERSAGTDTQHKSR
jgi:signal peptidase I